MKQPRTKAHLRRMADIKHNLNEAHNKAAKRTQKSLLPPRVVARQRHLIRKELIEHAINYSTTRDC